MVYASSIDGRINVYILDTSSCKAYLLCSLPISTPTDPRALHLLLQILPDSS
jgi:hypothetical protein